MFTGDTMFKRMNLKDEYISIRYDNLNLHICSISSGKFENDGQMHRHGKFYYELHLICGGKGRVITDNGEYELSSGDIYMTGPLINHEQLTDRFDNMEEYCLAFNISHRKNKPDTDMSAMLQKTYFWIGHDSGVFREYFERIADELRSRQPGCAKVIECLLTLIITELIRSYSAGRSLMSEDFSIADDRRIRITELCLASEYDTITSSELSGKLNLSERQLLRFLKKQYGKTFSQLKHEARMNAAVNMLRHGTDIETVASRTGYNDINYFKSCLKKFNTKKIPR